MGKATSEQSNRLSIFWLKKHGYLHREYSQQSGGIKWTDGWGESSINFSVIKNDWGTTYEEAYIELRYIHTDSWTDEKSNMNYKIGLTTTPCRYGGVRYWFQCPLYKRGQYCGRRVGVIFNVGKWFGCRHCGEIAYNSQMQGGMNKGFVSIPDIEQAEKEVKRYYYRGKPTRKYRRVIRLNKKFERNFIMLATQTYKRFGNLKK